MFGGASFGASYFGQAIQSVSSPALPNIEIVLIINRGMIPVLELQHSVAIECGIERQLALPILIGRTISGE